MVRYFFLILAICLMAVPGLKAQDNDCETILTQATAEYEAGHFSGIAAKLKGCLDNGFSDEQKQRAYLLLVQTYLILEDPIGAETSYLKLLGANPEFLPDESRDPIDVVYLSKRFTAAPVFSLFGKIGLNTTPVRVVYDVQTTGEQTSDDKYSLKAGYQISGGADWNITEKLSLTVEGGYAFSSFSLVRNGMFNSRDGTALSDRQHWFDLPVTLKFMDNKGRIRPYGYAGYGVSLLIANQGTLTITNNEPGASTTQTTEIESPSRNLKYLRNTLNRSMIIGGGVRFKINLNYIFADVRYGFGQSLVGHGQYTGSKNSELEGEPIFNFNYADDYYRLDRLSFSFGFVKPLYKPRELKRARTKSVLRHITKEE